MICLRLQKFFLGKNLLSLTVPIKIVKDSFPVSEIFWYLKILWIRAGTRITVFCRKCFVSLHRKLSYKNLSVFRKFSANEKFCACEENITTFYGEFCYLTEPKNLLGESVSVSIIWVSKKFLLHKDRSRFSVEGFLSRSARIIRGGAILCFRKNRIARFLIPHWGLHDFLSKNCCLRVAKKFAINSFCAVV